MEKGNLVQRRQDGALGIVIGLYGEETEALFGDGLREIGDSHNLRVVPFKPGAGIPANFVEMVEAYLTLRGFR